MALGTLPRMYPGLAVQQEWATLRTPHCPRAQPCSAMRPSAGQCWHTDSAADKAQAPVHLWARFPPCFGRSEHCCSGRCLPGLTSSCVRSPEHQTDNFWGLGPATGECDQSWIGLGDTTCLMALSTANSHTACSRAVKDLDTQIHIPEQLIDPFFITHSPATPALPQTGPMPGEC